MRSIEPGSLRESLTLREVEIVRLITDGLSSKEIAEKLFISDRTVDNHRARIMSKLGLRNTVDIVKFAIFSGIYSTESPSPSSPLNTLNPQCPLNTSL